MKKIYLIILLLICGNGIAEAEISGVVRNAQSEPIQGASLVLLELPDSTYVNGTLSEADGLFALTGNEAGKHYCMKVQAYGYDTASISIDGNTAPPMEIRLELASTELSEFVVKGKAPVTTREGGKFIFIPNDLADDMSSARNLMNHVPLVEWGERKVSIIGKGTSKIYLNGKDPHWDTVEVSAMLRTLDPHYIKRVEIITDPGASQDASFGGGIINIVYDDPTRGFRGNTFANLNLINDNPIIWPNLWLNYQKGKLKSSLNLDFFYNHTYTHSTDTYNYIGSGKNVVNDTKSSSFANMLTGKLNLSYDLTRNSELGVAVKMVGQRTHSKSTANTVTEEAGQRLTGKMQTTNDVKMEKPGINVLAYYTLFTDNKGSMLDVIAGYGAQANTNKIGYNYSDITTLQLLESDKYSFNAKANYTQVFDRKTSLTAGVYFLEAHIKDSQALEEEYDNFKYTDRQIHGFVQLNKQWNDVLSTDIGLRIENTHTRGFQLLSDVTDIQDYTDLFPTVSVSYNIPKGNQGLSLSYAKMINRPLYSSLNPYKTWSSSNTYRQGNAYLKPEYSHSVNLSYSLLNKLVFYASYYYTSPLTSSVTINTEDGMTVTSYTNTGRSHTFSFSTSFSTSVCSFWRISAFAWGIYSNIKTKAEGHYIHSSGWNYLLSQSNTFFISHTHRLTGTLSQRLNTPRDYGLYKEDWRYLIDANLSKSFTCGLEIGLYISIPITGYKNYKQFSTPDYSYDMYNHNHQYNIALTLSYSFGKKQVSGARDRTQEIK